MSEVLIKQLNELKRILQFTRNGARRNNVPKTQLQRAMTDIKKILKLMMIEPRKDDRHHDPHFYVDCFSSLLSSAAGPEGIKQLIDLLDIIISLFDEIQELKNKLAESESNQRSPEFTDTLNQLERDLKRAHEIDDLGSQTLTTSPIVFEYPPEVEAIIKPNREAFLKEKDQFQEGEWVLYEDGKLVHHSKNKIEVMNLIKNHCFFTCVGKEKQYELNVITYVNFYDGKLKQDVNAEIRDPVTGNWHVIPDMKVDTGATVTTLPQNLLDSLNIRATGERIECSGAFGPPVSLPAYAGSLKVEGLNPIGVHPIVPNTKLLLGTNALQFFRLETQNHHPTSATLFKTNIDLFS